MNPSKIVENFVGGFRRYGNPLEILWQRRRMNQLKVFRLVDRKTGVILRCRPASHRMFGEVWFDHDYDVPGVPINPGDVAIDIGANQGFFSCYLAHRGAKVGAFEPDPENLAFFELNIKANRLQSLIAVNRVAVKSSAGEISLYRTEHMGGGVNTTVEKFAKKLGFDQEEIIRVPAVTLPSILSQPDFARVKLCKLDCEGAELEIIQSLQDSHFRQIEAFAVEYHRDAYDPSLLIDALHRPGTHDVFLAADKSYCKRDLIYAVAKTATRAAVNI